MAVRSNEKLVTLREFAEIRKELRAAGERLVHCHGVFDLLHPGHLAHLEEAREQGERLVVTVTEDRHVRKGPGRPVFTQDLRMTSLAALAAVDWVVLSEHETAIPVIEAIQPDVYCKGREYQDADADVTQNIEREAAAVERGGGEVRYLGAVVFSSTKLLNRHFDALPAQAREFAEHFRSRYGDDDVRAAVDAMQSLRVLVVGEPIIDEYVTSSVLGVTGKDQVPSVRRHEHHRYLGGSFAIARHLAGFCGEVTLAGIRAENDDIEELIAATPGAERVQLALEVDPGAPTVVKQRFVVENALRSELHKVFSVNRLFDPVDIAAETRSRVRERIGDLGAEFDLVVVSDYGHGLLDPETMDVLQDRASFLSLNCQTNSSNHGFNPITKYRRADAFALDQTEIALAAQDRYAPKGLLLQRLRDHLGSRAGWLTLGSEGALGVTADNELTATPALTLHARDTIGAGDAFFALASLSARLGQPVEVGSFVGNCAGAIAVNVTGNAEPVGKVELLKFASTVLNV